VRPAQPRDVDAIADVHARAWQASYGDLLPQPMRESLTSAAVFTAWYAAVRQPPSAGHQVLVATARDLVTGFAATAPSAERDSLESDQELIALEVDPVHRGSGHGSRLLNSAVDTARDAGAGRMLIWLPTVDTARLAFLTAAGFALDGAERVSEDDTGARWSERRAVTLLAAAP